MPNDNVSDLPGGKLGPVQSDYLNRLKRLAERGAKTTYGSGLTVHDYGPARVVSADVIPDRLVLVTTAIPPWFQPTQAEIEDATLNVGDVPVADNAQEWTAAGALNNAVDYRWQRGSDVYLVRNPYPTAVQPGSILRVTWDRASGYWMPAAMPSPVLVRVSGYPATSQNRYQIGRFSFLTHSTGDNVIAVADQARRVGTLTLPMNCWVLDLNWPGAVAAGNYQGALVDITDPVAVRASGSVSAGANGVLAIPPGILYDADGDPLLGNLLDYLITGDQVILTDKMDPSITETALVVVSSALSLTLATLEHSYADPAVLVPGKPVFAPANFSPGCMVRVTSLTPDGDGKQPGLLSSYDGVLNIDRDGIAVKVRDPNA